MSKNIFFENKGPFLFNDLFSNQKLKNKKKIFDIRNLKEASSNDLTFLDNKVEFTDWVHVTQASRDFIAGRIVSEVIKIHDQKC